MWVCIIIAIVDPVLRDSGVVVRIYSITTVILCVLAIGGVVVHSEEEGRSVRRNIVPHVIAEQTTTRGRVVLLEEGRSGRRAVEGLRVQMWSLDDDVMIHDTRTEREGFFDLPRFELGYYRLHVGRMRLIVEIIEPQPIPEGYVEAPKVLFILASAEAL